MKNYSSSRSSKRGFTLIELLVVIAIIAILAAMGFGAGAMAINKAKKTHALSDCSNLVQAIQAFYDDYNTLPDVPDADDSPGAKSDSLLMNMLVGYDEENNPKEVRYFQGKDAKGSSAISSYGGLYYENNRTVELLDPWRKVSGDAANNRHFFVMLDGDYDDELKDPFNNDKPLPGRRAIVWCTGKDGLYTLGRQTSAENTDNVYSWR